MATGSDTSGAVLTLPSLDETACRIAEMWIRYNEERRQALAIGEEARKFVFATDMDQTSANILPHKNRTHTPKLTQISDNLQSQYYEASLSMPKFFRFLGSGVDDKDKAKKIEAWVRLKLEQRKFRDTVGRQLIADYVNYGNAFLEVDYIVIKDDDGKVVYKGPDLRRVSPLDMVMNPRAKSFSKSVKLTHELVHVAEIMSWPEVYPDASFLPGKIKEAINTRNVTYVDDWVELIKDRGISMDGFGGVDAYFKNDMAEIIVYRGDVYNPETGEVQTNRVVYVMDRVHVIRNEPSASPKGHDGVHHAGWRVRNDNLWAQGPLDNLIGIQYRIDHLENLRADVFDVIAHPVIVIKGNNISEPSEGYAPGAAYHVDMDGSVEMLVPDASALRADTQMALYFKQMEDFAGSPPESQGVRTPGEKTAFEVDKLDSNASKMFIDKARNFERMLETALREVFELMLINYDGGDYVEIFDDISGERTLSELSKEEINARGDFIAVGARHWQRRNRQTLELQNFMTSAMQDQKIRAHVKGTALTEMWKERLDFDDDQFFEPFAGAKEDGQILAVQQAEFQRLSKSAGLEPTSEDTVSGGGPQDSAPTSTGSEGRPGSSQLP